MKKKKRKIQPLRLALLIAIVVLSGVLIFLAARYISDSLDQKAKKDKIEEVIAKNEDIVESINLVSKPTGFSSDVFETLKSQVLADYSDSLLESYDKNERVETDYYEEVMALASKTANEKLLSLFLNIDQYPEDMVEYYLNDTDRLDFVLAYPDRDQYQSAPAALDASLTSVPLLIQWDLSWGYIPYGDSTIAIAGCAPTCLSMVFSYLLQDASITPYVIAAYSQENGHYVNGVGTAHSLLTAAAENWGVNVEGVSVDEESVKEALAEGKVLILNMVPGTFTRIGHFIVVSGEKDGKLVVEDPNSITRSSQLWDYDLVLSETAGIWAYY